MAPAYVVRTHKFSSSASYAHRNCWRTSSRKRTASFSYFPGSLIFEEKHFMHYSPGQEFEQSYAEKTVHQIQCQSPATSKSKRLWVCHQPAHRHSVRFFLEAESFLFDIQERIRTEREEMIASAISNSLILKLHLKRKRGLEAPLLLNLIIPNRQVSLKWTISGIWDAFFLYLYFTNLPMDTNYLDENLSNHSLVCLLWCLVWLMDFIVLRYFFHNRRDFAIPTWI